MSINIWYLQEILFLRMQSGHYLYVFKNFNETQILA